MIDSCVDISDKITVSDETANLVYAYMKAGWAFITLGIQATTTLTTFGTVASGYRPIARAHGFVNYQGTVSDVGRFQRAHVEPSGAIQAQAQTAFNSTERITFIYPIA